MCGDENAAAVSAAAGGGNGSATPADLANAFAESFTDGSTWIFGSNGTCSSLTLDEPRMVDFYSDLPASSGNNYWDYVQSTRWLVVGFCTLTLLLIPTVALHNSRRSGIAGCAHFLVGLQVCAGLAAVALYVAMLGQIAAATSNIQRLEGSASEIVSDIPASFREGFNEVAYYWGWSYWVMVGAVALALIGWPVLCILFCCTPKYDADGVYYK